MQWKTSPGLWPIGVVDPSMLLSIVYQLPQGGSYTPLYPPPGSLGRGYFDPRAILERFLSDDGPSFRSLLSAVTAGRQDLLIKAHRLSCVNRLLNQALLSPLLPLVRI